MLTTSASGSEWEGCNSHVADGVGADASVGMLLDHVVACALDEGGAGPYL